MSIRQLNVFFDENIDFESIMETLNKAYKGKLDISLSNYDTDAEPIVKIGSVFDVHMGMKPTRGYHMGAPTLTKKCVW